MEEFPVRRLKILLLVSSLVCLAFLLLAAFEENIAADWRAPQIEYRPAAAGNGARRRQRWEKFVRLSHRTATGVSQRLESSRPLRELSRGDRQSRLSRRTTALNHTPRRSPRTPFRRPVWLHDLSPRTRPRHGQGCRPRASAILGSAVAGWRSGASHLHQVPPRRRRAPGAGAGSRTTSVVRFGLRRLPPAWPRDRDGKDRALRCHAPAAR